MNLHDKTKEELNNELLEMQQSLKALNDKCKDDISLLGLSGQKIRNNEEMYRKAYLSSRDSININRLSDGMYVSVNEGFTKITGYTEEDVLGKSSIDINIWYDINDRKAIVDGLISSGVVQNKEAKFLSKSGTTIIGLTTASLIDLDGVPHILSIIRDITSRKQAEEALAHEHFLITALMNNLTDHVYFKDLDSKFIRTNKSHATSFGLDNPDEVIGKSDFDFFEETAARQAFEDEQTIIRTGNPMTKEEKHTRKDHSDVWFSTIKMPLREKDGKIIGTFGISRDITERKRIEFESHALFEITKGITVTDNLDDLLKLIHLSLSKVVYAENCFVALYNQDTGLFSFPYFVDKFDPTPSPISLGKSCSAYVFRTVKPLLLTQQLFDQLVANGEVELVGSNSPSWIGIPLQTPSKVIGVLVLQHYEEENVYSETDVNFLSSIGAQIAISIDRKKTEEEIILKNELLQSINAEKDKLFSIIAHDLRGPLSSFVAATQIITDEIQNMGIDEIKDFTDSMNITAINIYSLLENLLEWSRLRRGGMDFIPEKFSVRKKIEGCIDIWSESARKKEIGIQISISDDLEMIGDSHMFETVIRNLVSNAIKFTPPGGKVTIDADRPEDHSTRIRISDSGIGMTKELQNRLFQIDEKTNRPGTEGEPSTGLGLLLCKEFIEKHNGKIWVESEVGQGSTFYLSFP